MLKIRHTHDQLQVIRVSKRPYLDLDLDASICIHLTKWLRLMESITCIKPTA